MAFSQEQSQGVDAWVLCKSWELAMLPFLPSHLPFCKASGCHNRASTHQIHPPIHAERKIRFLMQLLLSTNMGKGKKKGFLRYEGCYCLAVMVWQLLNDFNGTFSMKDRYYILRYPGGTYSHIDLLSSRDKLNK